MKKNTKELIVIWGCIGIILTGFAYAMALAESKRKLTPLENKSVNIEKIESGRIEGIRYRVFRDKETGRRIFYFNGNMVVLPNE